MDPCYALSPHLRVWMRDDTRSQRAHALLITLRRPRVSIVTSAVKWFLRTDSADDDLID
jgi:hypothetical protein